MPDEKNEEAALDAAEAQAQRDEEERGKAMFLGYLERAGILVRLERLERHAGLVPHETAKVKTAADALAGRQAVKDRLSEEAAAANQKRLAAEEASAKAHAAELESQRLARAKAHADFVAKSAEKFTKDGKPKPQAAVPSSTEPGAGEGKK